MKSIIYTLAIISGNFTYQWLCKDTPDWLMAIDQSYFQSSAIIIYKLMMGVKG